MIVIFAEKPLQAEEYAKCLKIPKKDNYYSGIWNGQECIITNGLGHMVSIAEPAEQNVKWGTPWSSEQLPMIPEKFHYSIIDSKRNQYNLVVKFFQEASLIINATDCAREGELIFRLMYGLSGTKAPVKRLWIHDLTHKGILKGFQNLEDGSLYDNIYLEAKARSEADWLVGMNASRAITIRSRQTYSIGRVQTPTLALICERYLQFKDFKPESYWKIGIQFRFDKNEFLQASYPETFFDEIKAKALQEKISKVTTCKKIEKKDTIEKPPLPFSLGELQKVCNKKLQLSLTETLEIAQTLYEKHQLITYPRTDSSYITDSLFEEIPDTLQELKNGSYATLIGLLPKTLSEHCVDNSKVGDHFALLPTGKSDKNCKLTDLEKKVYEMIIVRFVEAFMPDCKKEITSFTFENEGEEFFAKGTVIRDSGYRLVKSTLQTQNDDDEDEKEERFPIIEEGERFEDTKPTVKKDHTKPKPIHTGATLLSAMQHCTNDIDDEEIKKVLRESKGLGSSATRDSFIRILIERGYVEVVNKTQLYPTEKGLNLYHAVKNHSISKALLTGEWESNLQKIGKGLYSYKVFMEEIKAYSTQIVKDMLQATIEVNQGKKKIGHCPKCQANQRTSIIYEGKKSFYCEDENCDFSIAKYIKGTELLPENAQSLLMEGKTPLIKFTFEDKDNKPYVTTRHLVLDKNAFGISFEKPAEEALSIPCPKCKETSLTNQEKRVYCKKCDFILYKEFLEKKLTGKEIGSLLRKQEINVDGLFSKKKEKTFSALLKLDDEGKVAMRFNEKK
ncbi:MAG: DNA topoisomerase [Raineya sp.]|jgi:DNA topoisomerase-3|nr:DNA topoisomerase [Raineya sp.]